MTKKPYACATPGCRKKITRKKICPTCATKRYRQRYPMMYAYLTLRSNAKRRHKVFTISFEYFKQFCYETNYMWGKGRTKNSFSVDRIKEELGYIEGNLQVLRVGKNKKKHLEYDWQNKQAKFIDGTLPDKDDTDPF